MSIIYDALKKVEKTTSDNAGVVSKAEFKPRHDFKVYLLSILGLVFGLFAANIFFGLFTPSRPSSSQAKLEVPPSQVRGSAPPVAAVPSSLPLAVTPTAENEKAIEAQGPLPVFTLNGIFFSQDGGYALMNNQIVRVGDTIGGATVKEITESEVVLEVQGSLIRLSSRS